VVFIFSSCKDSFFSEPIIPPSEVDGAASPPENISASQGEKRGITLSWNQMTNAVLYYVYKAASPLDVFVRCGETTSNRITFSVQPGSTVYYRISSVSYDGKESPQSFYVRGTSLAQPVITDITEVTESGSTVTWYMDNVSGDTYKNNLLYTVYCFSGSAEVAQLALDGSLIVENKAVFTGLGANTKYEYQVEAFLRSDQNTSEKSERMDAATARRFRPGPPVKLRATRGTAVDNVELSFELPEMVDITLGENVYDPKPLYFVISKRRYNPSNSNEYLIVCSYFGTDSAKAGTMSNGKKFNEYIPGAAVKWVDGNVNRGVDYEYMVQSYVDDTPRVISSDDSKSSAEGWALSEGNLSLKDVEYQYAPNQDLFGSATLPLDFEFDPKGIAYTYTLIETIKPLGDEYKFDPDGNISRKIPFTMHDIYVPRMDLTRKTDQSNPGRGMYSYVVEIRLEGSSPESAPLDIFEAIGEVEVSENTEPLVVEKFSVLDGFTDKFILKWHYWSNRKYTIFQSSNRTGPWDEIASVNSNPADDNNASDTENYEWTYSGQTTGVVKYFAIQPFRALGGTEFKPGQKVYASAASRTLGVPKLSPGGESHSYSNITALWTEAQKADTYRIKYWYTDDGSYQNAAVAKKVKASELSLDAAGNFKFTFSPFADNVVDVSKAGKEIQIAVDALNEGLQATVGGGEIGTTSAEEFRLRLVGPALLNLSASKAVTASEITVSWNSIYGADGYYVFRRQFNMNNTAEEGEEAVVYYVPASQSSSINVIGKNLLLEGNAKVDAPTVKASASFGGSLYQLQDIYMPDSDYDGSIYGRHTPLYRDQQNNLAWGYPYRYYVVPVVNRGGAPEPLTSIDFVYGKDGSNKNTGITSYTIRENNIDVRYTGAAGVEKEGFVIGFGQNVVATKGSYASAGNVNDGIEISWNPPPLLSTLAGFTPRYTLYRRAPGGTWTAVTSNVSELKYLDKPESGSAYEYVIGITNGNSGSTSKPDSSRRFIELCYTLRDEKNRPNMLGYMLGMVRLESVSRSEIKVGNEFAEEINWYSAGITNSFNSDPNWGIDGYTVFVMNRNINANWHVIADMNNIPNQTNLKVLVTNNDGTPVNVGGINHNLLKVLRDYKHFFKVRSYVMKGDEKIYCPDPAWTYTYRWGTTQAAHIDASDAMQNAYVKWGARQITRDEFIRIITLYLARGIEPNGWLSAISARTYNASTNMGGSGSVRVSSNALVTTWELDYRSYKNDMILRTGDWVTFITINGKVWAGTGASTAPQRYGDLGYVDVTGPWDTPGLYTGKFRIGGDNDDMYWNNANNHIYLQYPSANMINRHKNSTSEPLCEKVPWRGINTPLPYTGQNGGNASYNQEAWK
jgi:hypothetical protein